MRTIDADPPERLVSRLQDHAGLHADAVGHVAQTRHLQLAPRDDHGAEAMWEVARSAARIAPPRMSRLRFVTISTDSAGSFAAWVRSLRAALDDAGWRPGRGPEIEVLRVVNDANPTIDAAHRMVSADGITIHVMEAQAARRPLPLAEARPFAFGCVRELGWIPSPRAPVWSLDEDFRFDTLVPSPGRMFVRRSGGPLFHRLDALVARLAAEEGADVIIGGNTGAAPVPALGLVRGQVRDLLVDVAPRAPLETALGRLAQLADAYYDLADVQTPELRVPLSRAWWRDDGVVDGDDLARRLQAGLPITRPALAMPQGHPPSAWAHQNQAAVAGGNTVLLSARALDARFVHVRHGNMVSRRADTTWAIDARSRGVRVVRACLPFFHDRPLRPRSAPEAAREALTDALGVGLYRSMLAGRTSGATVLAAAESRLAALRPCLAEAEAAARLARVGGEALEGFADWLAEAREGLVLAKAELRFFERKGLHQGMLAGSGA